MPLLSDLSALLQGLLGYLVGVGAQFYGQAVRQFGFAVGFLLVAVMLFDFYLETIRRKYIAAFPWTFLQVRVPEANTRTPRGMEEVFNVLHGGFRPPDLYDLYLDGYLQPWFSAEIRGTPEGVSLVFRIPTALRQMFEGTVYAQYPEAEILDVEDYTASYRAENLEKEFDLWGSEMILGKDDAYPLKTYVDFEDEFAEDGHMVDTMAAVTELASAIDPGEEIWFQILFRPEFRTNWQRRGEALALKLAQRPVKKTPTALQRVLGGVGKVVQALVPGPPPPERRPSPLDLGALRLTPGETDVVRAIQRNVAKIGFGVQIRVLSLGPMGKYARRKRISPIFGVFRQFSTLNLNDLRPNAKLTTSRPTYGLSAFRQRWRKRRLLRRYQQRYFRERGFILNSEELATLYHFPVIYTQTPTVEHARAKKGEPPPDVPLLPLREG